MSKIISKRAIKGKPIKRAATYTERTTPLSKSELFNTLMTSPNKEKKIAAYRRLSVYYGLKPNEIDDGIRARKSKQEFKNDLADYARGAKSAKEVSEKWNNKYSPEQIHTMATHEFKVRLPDSSMKVLRFKPLYKGFSKDGVSEPGTHMGQFVQQPLYFSAPLWYKAIEIANEVKKGTKTPEDFEEFLLKVAESRPEFMAHIAHMLFTQDMEKFDFKRESGLKEQMLNLLTERKFSKNKNIPLITNKDREKQISNIKQKFAEETMKLSRGGKRELDDETINRDRRFDSDLYGSIEGPLDRKKRRKKVIVKRKVHRIKKKCRCK